MRKIFFGLLAAIVMALPAQAQTIEQLSVADVTAVLDHYGYYYEEASDARGFPLLRVNPGPNISAQSLNVFFYGCDTQNRCEDITLYSWYDTAIPLDASFLHAWNDIFRQQRNWSRAYIDEDADAVLVMNINATGGLGANALHILMATYLAEASEFGTYVGAE